MGKTIPFAPSPSHHHKFMWYKLTIPNHGWFMTLFYPRHGCFHAFSAGSRGLSWLQCLAAAFFQRMPYRRASTASTCKIISSCSLQGKETNTKGSFGIPEISKLEEIGQKKGDIPGKPDAVREIWKCVVLKIGHQGDQKWRYLF